MSVIMSKEAYIKRITDCSQELRRIADNKLLGDGTTETWACGQASSLLNAYIDSLDSSTLDTSNKSAEGMYYVTKTMYISAAHKLSLDYDSPCQNLHGHEWRVTVYCRSTELNNNGMIIDFKQIKQLIHDNLDHHYINDVVDFNPTAENLAKWVVDSIPCCYKAEVEESKDNWACYERY